MQSECIHENLSGNLNVESNTNTKHAASWTPSLGMEFTTTDEAWNFWVSFFEEGSDSYIKTAHTLYKKDHKEKENTKRPLKSARTTSYR